MSKRQFNVTIERRGQQGQYPFLRPSHATAARAAMAAFKQQFSPPDGAIVTITTYDVYGGERERWTQPLSRRSRVLP